MTIRVVLVDDQALVRAGFRMVLDAEADIEVVGEAADGLQAIQAARRLRPDVVLMDIRMPNLDGIQATRRLAGPGVADPVCVLILTTYDVDEYVFAALRAGACGFLLKHTSPEGLVEAIRTVASGEGLIAPSVTRRLIAEFARAPASPEPPRELQRLTDREREVLELVARGINQHDASGATVGVCGVMGGTATCVKDDEMMTRRTRPPSPGGPPPTTTTRSPRKPKPAPGPSWVASTMPGWAAGIGPLWRHVPVAATTAQDG
jgi:DNA-binding NarL/FixJ family response regulator